ncbi:hypothetical protein V1477_020445 [Vespula maculifrons]|uniref:Uncharacterized protein n=1 Tax=Vespula maculifrons TaxID=7453 RepID=A0ABD2APN9_VESMC
MKNPTYERTRTQPSVIKGVNDGYGKSHNPLLFAELSAFRNTSPTFPLSDKEETISAIEVTKVYKNSLLTLTTTTTTMTIDDEDDDDEGDENEDEDENDDNDVDYDDDGTIPLTKRF